MAKIFKSSIWYTSIQAYIAGDSAALNFWSEANAAARRAGRQEMLSTQRSEGAGRHLTENSFNPGMPLTEASIAPDTSSIALLPEQEPNNEPHAKDAVSPWAKQHYGKKYSRGACSRLCLVLNRQRKLFTRDKKVMGWVRNFFLFGSCSQAQLNFY